MPRQQPRQPHHQTGRFASGDQFTYVFPFGDDWAHLFTIDEQKIDLLDTVGINPALRPPTGLGHPPDQYDRAWGGEAGETPQPKRPTGPWQTCHPSCPAGDQDADHRKLTRLRSTPIS